jgi:uncharacterized protein
MIRRLLLVMLLLVAAPAAAQDFPQLTGRVVDAADLLTPQQEQELTQRLEALERASSRQLVVATIPNLQERPIEDYGYQLGRHWGIGQSGSNNGAILIVAPNDRKVRVEVGYGLEPILTDAFSNTIIEQQILPRFRDGDMAAGIIAGADALIEQLGAPPEEAERRALEAAEQQREGETDGGTLLGILFWIVVVVIIVIAMISRGIRRGGRRYGTRGRRRRRGGWGAGPVIIWGGGSDWGGGSGGGWGGFGGGGGGGGGFGGFSGGGGSFGGGGASGSW